MDNGVAGRVDLHGDLLHAWASWARDPAAPVAEWLWLGAPAGVAVDFSLDGLLEAVPPESPIPLDQLASDYESVSNYTGVEDDPAALDILNGYIERGWLKEFDSLSELSEFVGGNSILNKCACISKERQDGTVKRRIIVDAKRSQVIAASRKQYKSVLPLQTDLSSDVLALLSLCMEGERIALFVCDAEDAYWQIPLNPAELTAGFVMSCACERPRVAGVLLCPGLLHSA